MTAPSLALVDLRAAGKLTTRAYQALRSEGIESLGELATWRAIRLTLVANIGAITMAEIRELMSEHGLTLLSSSGSSRPGSR